jgi:hypothetical protein
LPEAALDLCQPETQIWLTAPANRLIITRSFRTDNTTRISEHQEAILPPQLQIPAEELPSMKGPVQWTKPEEI